MPSKSLTPEEKAKVTSAIPSSFNKILIAVPARVYFAHPRSDKWSYSGLQGALALTYDISKDVFFLKLVDFFVWHHELYDQFEYHKDRPFFWHSFPGDVVLSPATSRLVSPYLSLDTKNSGELMRPFRLCVQTTQDLAGHQ